MSRKSSAGQWFNIIALSVAFISLALSAYITSQKKPMAIPSEAACTKCSGTGYSCSSNKLYQCKDKCLRLVDDCNYPTSDTRTCSALSKACINKCIDGAYRCVVNSNGYSEGQKCIKDKWTLIDSCGYNEKCCSQWGTCVPINEDCGNG